MRRLPVLLACLAVAALGGCQGAGEGSGRFSGFYLGATGGFARDADGRRVDLDAPTTAPSVPSAATAGFGR